MSQKAVALTEKYENIWASAGVHPTEIASTNYELEIMNYEKLIGHPKVMAIGEVGLDYYRIKDEELRIKQKEVLKKFIDLAVAHNKPLIIHCREAYGDLLEILNSYFVIPNSILSGVIHSWTSTWENAKKFLDIGYYIGLNGIITFTDQYNETAINAPLDKILLETDAPFLAPVPNRGKRNEPLWVKYVAEQIAKLRNISVEEVVEQTTKNTEKLFNLPKF